MKNMSEKVYFYLVFRLSAGKEVCLWESISHNHVKSKTWSLKPSRPKSFSSVLQTQRLGIWGQHYLCMLVFLNVNQFYFFPISKATVYSFITFLFIEAHSVSLLLYLLLCLLFTKKFDAERFSMNLRVEQVTLLYNHLQTVCLCF